MDIVKMFVMTILVVSPGPAISMECLGVWRRKKMTFHLDIFYASQVARS